MVVLAAAAAAAAGVEEQEQEREEELVLVLAVVQVEEAGMEGAAWAAAVVAARLVAGGAPVMPATAGTAPGVGLGAAIGEGGGGKIGAVVCFFLLTAKVKL